MVHGGNVEMAARGVARPTARRRRAEPAAVDHRRMQLHQQQPVVEVLTSTLPVVASVVRVMKRNGRLEAVSAVLLDMDGTLVDSDAAVERAWSAWAAEYDVDLAAVLAIAHGTPAELADLLDTNGPEPSSPDTL